MSITDKLITVADNTPAVADVVNSAKATASGAVVRVDDVLDVEHGLGVQLVSKNLFNINIIGSLGNATYVTNNGDGTLSVDCGKARPVAISETLGMVAPDLKVGETYTLSATSTDTYKYIYLQTAKTTWRFGASKIITQEMLDSKVYFYAELGTTATVSDIQIEAGSTATPFTPYCTDFGGVVVSRYGKNLVDYTKATGRNANQKVEIVDGGVLWKAGGNYYFEVPVNLPAGITVICSATATNEAEDSLLHYTLVYEDDSYTSNAAFGTGASHTSTKKVKAIRIYKANSTNVLSQDLLVSNIQVELGTTATAYEPYKAPQTATADANGKVTGLVSISPTITLMADNDAVALDCTYFPVSAADTVAKYQQLKAEETTLQEYLRECKEESV